MIFAREIDDLVNQHNGEVIETDLGIQRYHAGYQAALERVQQLLDVYGWKKR